MPWIILIVCGLVGFMGSLWGLYYMITNCPEVGFAEMYRKLQNPGNRPRWIGLVVFALSWLVYLLSKNYAHDLLSGAGGFIFLLGFVNLAFPLLLTLFGDGLGKSFREFVELADSMFPSSLPARTWGIVSLVVFASLNYWLGWLQYGWIGLRNQ